MSRTVRHKTMHFKVQMSSGFYDPLFFAIKYICYNQRYYINVTSLVTTNIKQQFDKKVVPTSQTVPIAHNYDTQEYTLNYLFIVTIDSILN